MAETGKDFLFRRQLDRVGRIVVPRDLRRALGWEANTHLTLHIENGNLVIKKEMDEENS